MAKSVAVPSLGASLMLTNPGDILIDVIRRFQTNYEGSSDITPQQTESYQYLITHFGSDRSRLAQEAQQALERIYKRVFPTDTVSVTVTPEDVPGKSKAYYSLVIKAAVTRRGVYYSVKPTITIQNGIPVIMNDKVDYATLSQLPS